MAGTTTSSYPAERAGTSTGDAVIQLNKVIDDLERLRARLNAVCVKLDADAGVTDTNYTAGTYSSTAAISAASSMTAAKIGDHAGAAITA